MPDDASYGSEWSFRSSLSSKVFLERIVTSLRILDKRGSRAVISKRGITMKLNHTMTIAVVASLFAAGTTLAQEKKIKRGDLPPAVEKTVASQSQGATIKGFSQEKENGQTFYEAELMINGHSKDILMDANGAIVEVEEQIEFEKLPAEVKTGLTAKAGKGTIKKVESITKHDKLVAYEAQLITDSKRSEVQVGPDGKPLDHEE
jgi:hypothetical protein